MFFPVGSESEGKYFLPPNNPWRRCGLYLLDDRRMGVGRGGSSGQHLRAEGEKWGQKAVLCSLTILPWKDLKVVCHPMMRINVVRKTLVGSSWGIYVSFMLLARYQYSPSFEELLPQPVFYYVTSSYSVTRKSVLPRSLLLNAPAPFVIMVGGWETLFIRPHRYTALGFRWWITSLLHC